MKRNFSGTCIICVAAFFLFTEGCKKQSTPAADPCTNTSITISATVSNAIPCESTPAGSITVSASGSSGYTYNINSSAYQSDNTFGSLSAGAYTIGVKDGNGCTNTKVVTVSNATQGTNFTNVRTIINSKCGGCHLSGGNDGGVNFDDYCSIVTKWSRINVRCVTQGDMPPSGLTTAQKAQITAWVNAGHRYSD